MKKIRTIVLLLVALAMMLAIAGCGPKSGEALIYGDYYTVKVFQGTKGNDGKPLKFITVVSLQKEKDDKRYHFKQSLFSVGRSQVTDRVLSGSYDEKTRTLTIGDLQPFVFSPKADTMEWVGEKYTHITKENEKDFDAVMEEALKQRAQ